MSTITTDSRNYGDIADAIRAKGVIGSFKPREMADAIGDISSSAINDGIAVKARNANGNATEIDYYGSIIYPETFGVNTTYTSDRRSTLSEVTQINWKNPITEVKYCAFCAGFNGFTSITFPKSPCTFNQFSFGKFQDRITSADIQGGGTFLNECFRQWSGLLNITLGSVGYPVLSMHNKAFNYDTQANLNIIAFCDGAYADTLLASIRNGAVSATIVIKASENTAYNGVNYSAGDTMITSSVEA